MPTSLAPEQAGSLAELARLRRFTGPPAEFWSPFIAAASELAGACRGALVYRAASDPVQWRKIGEWAAAGRADPSVLTFTNSLTELAAEAAAQGTALRMLEVAAVPDTHNYALALRLQFHRPEEVCIGAFLLLNVTEAQVRDVLLRLHLVSDTPASYQQNQLSHQARADVEKFANTLDLMAAVNEEKRFLAATLAFCNGLATRHACDRVSLGWLEGDYIHLRTMSRTEKFDRKMAAAQGLETAMEESFDQDEELVWPAPEGATAVTRDHEKFARDQSVNHLCSLPMRVEDKALAVLTCERQGRPFSELELQQLRLSCDQAARRLADLKKQDRWFGARWTSGAKDRLARLVGPEHTWAKVLTVVVVALLVLACLPIWDYRVEGNFILRSEDVTHVAAPFDGYIARSAIRPGDVLKKDGELFGLNTVDLELEEAAAMADLNRYVREAEKARAAEALADMRISEALGDQVRARLDVVRHRLKLAVSRAPYDGIVIEGDLRQRLGAPVKQGEALFRLARTDTLYVEAEINERDVHELLAKKSGEIAFVSQPKLKFPVKIVRLEPAASAKSQGNFYVARLEFIGPPEPWWRPGMSGLCKIEIGQRTPIWVATHRTVDYLRLFFWW